MPRCVWVSVNELNVCVAVAGIIPVTATRMCSCDEDNVVVVIAQ